MVFSIRDIWGFATFSVDSKRILRAVPCFGVPMRRALLFGVHIRTPDFWKLPNKYEFTYKYIHIYIYVYACIFVCVDLHVYTHT